MKRFSYRWLVLAMAAATAAGCASQANHGADEGLSPAGPKPASKAPGATAPATAPYQSAAPATTEPGTVTPEMMEALRDLSAEDFQTRRQAEEKLHDAMIKRFQQMVLVQEMMLQIEDDLAEQFRQLAMAPGVQEESKVAGLMEFNQALSRWAIDALSMGPEKREAMLKWGLSREAYPLVVQAYSEKTENRAAAARELAKLDSPGATWLLGKLLDDPEREVSLSAMDVIYNKTPTPQMVDVIWNKSLGAMQLQFHSQTVHQKSMNVHGRIVIVGDQENDGNRMQDADVAVDVLIHWKSPLVLERLNALFKQMAAATKDPSDYRWRMISPNYGENGKGISRLLEAYKPKEGFVFIVRVLGIRLQDGYVNQMNNRNYWQSTRVDAAALLIQMTNQDPADYKISKLMNYNDRSMLETEAKAGDQAGAMKEEQQMVRKLLLWWDGHHKEFGVEEAPVVPKEEKDANAGGGPGGPGMGAAVMPHMVGRPLRGRRGPVVIIGEPPVDDEGGEVKAPAAARASAGGAAAGAPTQPATRPAK